MICIGTLSFAQPQSEIIMHDTAPIVQRDTYKTEDILLLFKSCYETIYFLGNTKYKRSKTRIELNKSKLEIVEEYLILFP